MKAIFSALLLVSATIASTANAGLPSAKGTSVEKQDTMSDIYIPGGFSSETESYVVVNGMYPSTCYSFSRSEVTNKDPLNHEIRTFSMVKQGEPCLMVFVPYHNEVRLGRLASGEHTLLFVNGDGTSFPRKLVVE
jgi:hypothetical protein